MRGPRGAMTETNMIPKPHAHVTVRHCPAAASIGGGDDLDGTTRQPGVAGRPPRALAPAAIPDLGRAHGVDPTRGWGRLGRGRRRRRATRGSRGVLRRPVMSAACPRMIAVPTPGQRHGQRAITENTRSDVVSRHCTPPDYENEIRRNVEANSSARRSRSAAMRAHSACASRRALSSMPARHASFLNASFSSR